MPVRAVEGKNPYTGGKAIEIDENKVISLRLRDENNLIIWDEGDNEIYVDLQLDDEIRPTDAFPVGVTTGRVLVDNGWDATGSIICAKTTSGDNIKLFYADNGKLYIDNGTGTFKQIYFKGDVDAIASALQNQIDTIMGLGKFLSIWNCVTGLPTSFPLDLPYTYSTGDWYLVGVVDSTTNYQPSGSQFTGVASTTVEQGAPVINDVYIYDGARWMKQSNSGVGGGVTFAQIIGQPTDNQNLATALGNKQNALTTGTGISIDANNEIANTGVTSFNGSTGAVTYTAPVTSVNNNTGAVTVREFNPGTGNVGDVVTKTALGYEWAAPTGGSEIVYATQAEYTALLPGAASDGKHYFIYSTSGGGGWQPGANTLLYYPLTSDLVDSMGNGSTGTMTGTCTFDSNTGIHVTGISGNYVTGLSSGVDGKNTFTLNVWIKYQAIYNNTIGYILGYVQSSSPYQCLNICCNDGYVNGMTNGSGGESWLQLYARPDTTWHNICVVGGGDGKYTWYVDGTSIGQTTSGTLYNFSTFNLGWGGRYGVNRSADGYIKDFIVETVAWTGTEISTYYNDTKGDYGIS